MEVGQFREPRAEWCLRILQKNKSNILFSLLNIVLGLFLYCSSPAQSLPDTIAAYKPIVKTYNELPNLADPATATLLDTLINPRGFIFKDEHGELRIILEEHKHWKSWSLLDGCGFFGDVIERTERISVGSGRKDKLLIYWSHHYGRSDWQNSFTEKYKGIQLWDLETNNRMLEVQTVSEYQHWWTIYQEDSSETIPPEERNVSDSGGESSFYTIEIQYKKSRIIINP